MNGQHLIMVLFHIIQIFASKMSKEHPTKYLQYRISPIFIPFFKNHKCINFFITKINK